MGNATYWLDDDDTPLLTEKQFAQAVGLAPITIRKKRTQGLIPHFRFGRVVRYSRGQLEAFLAQAHRKSTPKSKAR